MTRTALYCTQCGQPLRTDARFCGSCGQPIGFIPVGMAGMPTVLATGATPPLTAQDERNFAMYCHLASLIGWVLPFGDLIATLLLWNSKKGQSAFVDAHGKEALNYQISFYIYAMISTILVFVLIGVPMLAALGVFDVVVMILAAVKASNGELYRYPLTIRLIK